MIPISLAILIALILAPIVTLLRRAVKGFESSIRILSWGGLRGGLSLALALSLPRNASRSWILVATYSVVLFSVAVQGGSMDLILKKLLKK